MYKIKCKLPNNREPWNISLEERKKILLSAIKEGKKVALMLYHHADTSTFRYRCYNVLQATEKSQSWRSVYFYMNEMETIMELLPSCRLLILTRIKWEHILDDLVRKAHKLSIPVLFDIDDLVCNLQYLKLVTNTLNVHFGSEIDYNFWFADISRIQYAASLADGFITTNAFLGEMLQKTFQKPYQIIMNSLNQEQLSISEICSAKKKQKKSTQPFTIGYFSGTPSHINDFRMIYKELIQLLKDYPKMELQVVGFMEFPAEMQELIAAGRVKFHPLVDFMELQRLIAEVDVNIVPLVQNTFTNCKSELKYFEAAVVDTITVATPIYTYKNAIEDGKTGFLCNQGQWYRCISEIYENPERAKEICAAAKEYCLRKYAGENFVRQIEDAYNFFIK